MKVKTITKKGYKLHLIDNHNFKTISVKVIFWEKIKKEELTLRNALINNLLFSSKNYKTEKEITIKKENLYGAFLGGGSYRRGNYVFSEVNLSFIEDKFSEKGQIKNTMEFFFDVLTNPNIENNEFNRENFEVNYEIIKSDITAEKENPVYYSILEYKKLIGKDKPFSFPIQGTLEDLDKITPKNLYDYYLKFTKNNNIDIFVIGNIEKYNIEQYFKDIFSNNTSHSKEELYLEYEKEFTETSIKTNFAQSRLVMGGSLKNLTKHEKKYASLIFNIIFGSSPNSKLFKNVREKNSYAYSISSSINRLDGVFLIQAGISKENYENTKKEIKLALDEMKQGKFTMQDIKDAKAVILGLIREISDYQGAIVDHTFNHIYLDNDEEKTQIEEIKKISKQDIIEVANKINIDTILLVEEKENERD